jgi:ADP-heptose:LPS heptosyltransferase
MTINCQHVLICRTDNIGDLVLTLPMVAQLKASYPSIKISFLCRAYAAPIVRLCDDVDDVIEWESVSSDLTAYLKKSDIDTILIAQPERSIAKAAFFARIPNRIGNTRQKLYLLLYCNRGVRFSKSESLEHEAQMNFAFLKPFGIKHCPKRDEIKDYYHFTFTENANIQKMLAPYGFNLIFHTKSNGHGREWPIPHYIALAQLLEQHPEVHIWLTGSANEGQWIQDNYPALLNLSNVSSLFGKFNLTEFTQLIKQADGLIASGTGPLHVSAAIGQRTIGLFPPTKPMNIMRWEALGERAHSLSIAEAKHLDCRKTTSPSCECMEEIKPLEVFNLVSGWIKQDN